MVNVWDYVNAKKIKITDCHGKTYTGNLVCVMDEEENGTEEDNPGKGEDDITIETKDGRFIGFLQSEIEKIEEISNE